MGSPLPLVAVGLAIDPGSGSFAVGPTPRPIEWERSAEKDGRSAGGGRVGQQILKHIPDPAITLAGLCFEANGIRHGDAAFGLPDQPSRLEL